MFSRVRSAVVSGLEGREVFVETDVSRGLPGVYIVGLASTMVMESRERIRSAIVNSGLEYPRGRITVNLTPASLRKNGSGLDLPIAIGVLAADGYIDPAGAEAYGIIGELALDGKVLEVKGVLPMLFALLGAGVKRAVIPRGNAEEARLVSGMAIFTADTLAECVDIINGVRMTDRVIHEFPAGQGIPTGPDFRDIRGQEGAKRAIMIAVAGRHGLLMVGSPGCGKTMLASRIPSIMPPMNNREIIETAIIYSASGHSLSDGKGTGAGRPAIVRPFRQPHHTIRRGGMAGGGLIPVPGEITLAHNGVLFLDEVCEFGSEVIEALRTPMEERKITHFRQGESYTFPCNFQLVMASNPCPCGYFGDPEKMCKCTEAQLERYRKKLSGPIMDRIDMKISMEKVEYTDLSGEGDGMSSADMREAIRRASQFAAAHGRQGSNSLLSEKDTAEFCRLGREESAFMDRAYKSLAMSPRAFKKTLRVARTIADLAGSIEIKTEHLAEALSYRIMDRINE